MTRFLLLLLVILSLDLRQSLSQDLLEVECATHISAEHVQRMIVEDQIFQLGASERAQNEIGPRTVIAVTAHILRRTDGTGGITQAAINNELAITNGYFKNAGLEFYVREFNYINNTNHFNFIFENENAMANPNDRPNTINIYFVSTLKLGDGETACGYAIMPGMGPDRILMRNDCAVNGSTLTHEIGHFFNLIHTHGPNDYSDELVNGSNCTTAGDLVCDTPADPKLSIEIVNSSCHYIGTARDANLQFYQPNVRNIMSYSRTACRDQFSPMQYARMANSYAQHRSYLQLKPTRAAFYANEEKICQGSQISFTNVSVGAASYNWSFQGGTPSTSNAQNPNVTYNTPGTYNVTLTVNSGSGMTDTYSIINYITVKPSPNATAYVSESFENANPLNGLVFNEDQQNTFAINTNVGSSGNNSAWINMFESTHTGTIDRLDTKPFLATSSGTYLIQFDYAYKHRNDFQDRLEIYRSSYCRNRDRELLWRKSGSDLSKGNAQNTAFLPVSTDWFQEGVFFEITDITDVYNLAFDVRSAGGNNLYIDNYKIRKTKPLDADSLILRDLYYSTGGVLPWDLRLPVSMWAGVQISGGRVVVLNFSNFDLDLNLNFSLAGLDQLRTIDLSGNRLTLSNAFLQIPILEHLTMNQGHLTQLPNGWFQMTNLKSLKLDFNALSTLPTSLLELSELTDISFKGNKLTLIGDPFLSTKIVNADFSYNLLHDIPIFQSSINPNLINLSSNQLTFSDLEGIPVAKRPKYIVGPQRFFGNFESIVNTEDELIEITCSIPDSHAGTTIRWYKNGIEVTDFSGDHSPMISNIEENRGYYQCKATNSLFPSLELSSYPIQVNTNSSICDRGVAGTYNVQTTGTRAAGGAINVSKQVLVSASMQLVYNFTDISGGVEAQYYGGSAVPAQMRFICGQFSGHESNNTAYYITKTVFDHTTGDFSIQWQNTRGDKGTSNFTLFEAGYSNQAKILDFFIPIQVGPTEMDFFNKKIKVALGCIDGSPPAVFELSNGATAYINGIQQISGVTVPIAPGPFTYTVIAEDGIHQSNWVVTFDESPRTINALFTSSPQYLCNEPDGAASVSLVTVNGFVTNKDLGIYNVEWSNTSSFEEIVGDEFTLQGQVAGTYYLRITEKESGCRTPHYPITINDNTRPAQVSINVLSHDKTCSVEGISNGSLRVAVSGIVSSNYSIDWFRDGENDAFGHDEIITGLPAGKYWLKITNLTSGCDYNRSADVLSRPSVLVPQHQVTAQTDCANPNGEIAVSNIRKDGINIGVPISGYVIEWSNTLSFSEIIHVGNTLSGKPSGTYFYRVTDLTLDCKSTVNSAFVPAQTLDGPINIVSKADNNYCNVPEGNGGITVNVGGATIGYTFQWYNGQSISGTPIATGNALANIRGGTYTVKVTQLAGDNAGCFTTLTTSISNVPNQLAIDVSKTNVTHCVVPNGSASIATLRLNGNQVFLGGNFVIEWSRSIAFNNILSYARTISGLAPGNYYVRVREQSSGCSSIPQLVEITENFIPINPQVASTPNVNCTGSPNGSLHATGLASSAEFQYEWFRVVGEVATQVGSVNLATGLGAGIYTLVVTHLPSACTYVGQYEVAQQTITPVLAYNIIPQTSCAAPNGANRLSGITENTNTTTFFGLYLIQWSDSPNFNTILSTGAQLNNRAAGRYYVRATNNGTGCTSAVGTVDIPANLSFPQNIRLIDMEREKPNLGELGSLTIAVDFAHEFNVDWYRGSEPSGVIVGSGTTLLGAAAGAYTAKVTGSPASGGCVSYATFELFADRRIPQIVEFTLPERHFEDGPEDLMAEASSGLPLSFEILEGVGSLDGNVLFDTPPGSISIRIYNNGNDIYFPVESVMQFIVEGNYRLGINLNPATVGLEDSRRAVLYDLQGQIRYQSIVDAGQLLFLSVKRGNYYLKVLPLDGTSDGYFSYYYKDKVNWQEADILYFDRDSTINVELLARKDNDPIFNTILRGGVYASNNNSRLIINALRPEGEPKAGMQILLYNFNGQPVGMATSDGEGNFEIAGMPPGKYYIILDVFGLELNTTQLGFEIKETKPTVVTIIVGNGPEVELEVITSFENAHKSSFKVYPNPTSNLLTVSFSELMGVEKSLEIYNTSGKRVFSVDLGSEIDQTIIAMDQFPQGMYLVKLSSGLLYFVERVIKQ